MIGFACGSLLSGPLSETFGRNAVYIATMVLFLIFIMASALAPNLQAHLVFRFIAGLFASTPLSCAGGTVADLWSPLQKTYAFPFYAVPAFVGPMVGQIIGAYIPATPALGWRWLEWIMLILGGAILCIIVIFLPETYGNLILRWKAKALRQQTGNERYRSPMEMNRQSLGQRLRISTSRPFAMFYSELIIILLSLYLTIMYIVLFTFLEGYTYVFGETYGISQGLTSICWAGMLVGVLFVIPLIPVVYTWTASEYKKTSAIAPETRLWYAMLGGAPAVPISLFWMGWTSNVSVQCAILNLILFTDQCPHVYSHPFPFGLRSLPRLLLVTGSPLYSSFRTCISSIRMIYMQHLRSDFLSSRGMSWQEASRSPVVRYIGRLEFTTHSRFLAPSVLP